MRSTLVGVALLIIWVWSAGYAALHGFLDNLAPLPPKTWHSGLPVLAAYAIIGPAPTAVGRWLFAPELRDAGPSAAEQHGVVAARALWTASTGCSICAGC